MTIFTQNIRAIILAAILGIFTLGVTDVIIFMLPWVLVGFAAGQLAAAGESGLVFVLAAILPHALFELPALLLAAAAALRWHTSILARPPDRTVSQNWVLTMADFGRVLVGLVIPLLIVAAFVESYVTPTIMLWVYGD